MAVYMSMHAALDPLDHAQREIDLHVASDAQGRCLRCGELEPCPAREAANELFLKYDRLPTRQPGLAYVECEPLASMPSSGFAWFTDPVMGGY